MKKEESKNNIIIKLIILLIISVILLLYINNTRAIFEYSHQNYATIAYYTGYRIYANGVIKEFDKYDKNNQTKKAKITKQELNELKDLIYQVKDKLENNSDIFDMQLRDYGTITCKVYSSRLNRWIILREFGDGGNASNKTEESQKILKLTEELYNKYIKY